MFIGHLKRFHLHKRLLMAILGIINHYIDLKENLEPNSLVPRVHFFAGKASPESVTNKAIIQLINRVKDVLNQDPDTSGILKLVFLPNFCMSQAEKVIPALDVAELIS